jgi:polysaccharide biosynthesis transport protein
LAPEITPALGPQRATAREFLSVIFRRRWIILGLFAVTLGTVLVMMLATPASYVSVGQVLVRRGEQQSSLLPYRQVPNEWEIELGSEVQAVRGRVVLQGAQKILDQEHRGQPTPKLREDQVGVEVTGKTNVLAIAYSDGDPRVAELGCDALLRAYIAYRQGSVLTYPQRFFDTEISKAETELGDWMAKRREFATRTGIVDLATQRTNYIGLRANLSQRRAEEEASLAEAVAQFRLMSESRRADSTDVPSLLMRSANDGTIDEVTKLVIQQETRLAKAREQYQDDSPEVVNAGAVLDSLRRRLQRELDDRYAVARSRVAVQQSKVDAITRELAGVDAKLAMMGDVESQSEEMDHQISTWQERYTDLAKSSDQARVNQNTVPTISVVLLNPASPARPENARDYVRLGLAPAFSLVVGVGLAFFVDGLDLTVHTPSQAEEETHLPVLAAISERRRRRGGPAGPGGGEEDAA